jgi:hypothetical protein
MIGNERIVRRRDYLKDWRPRIGGRLRYQIEVEELDER